MRLSGGQNKAQNQQSEERADKKQRFSSSHDPRRIGEGADKLKSGGGKERLGEEKIKKVRSVSGLVLQRGVELINSVCALCVCGGIGRHATLRW